MIAVLCAFATIAAAQNQPAPKWELFGGYSGFYPGSIVNGQLPLGLFPISSKLEINPRGAGASFTYNFNRWLGITVDSSTDWGSQELTVAKRIDDAAFGNLSIGPKITFRRDHFSFFLEGLVGDHRLMPDAFHDIDKFGLMAGGGTDVNIWRHVALRLVRADFVYSDYKFGSPTIPMTRIRGLRLQAGVNLMFGGERTAAVAPSAVCSAQPMEVFAGEPVTATASGSNFHPKHSIKYTWNGTGLRVSGSDASTQIDTSDLQPRTYGANAGLSDGTKNGTATCTARFTVRDPRPPVISCPADPSSVQMGDASTIRSHASSPDGRGLTYRYSTSAGEISGNRDTATLSTRGAQPGRITVTCTVSDDRNPALMASAATIVNVEARPTPAPEPAQTPQMQQLEANLALHSIYFQTARPTIANPNGGLVDSQEEILTALASDFVKYLKYRSDAHLILGGHADPRGSVEYNKGLTERRVDRTKEFLVAHGVPADHIETMSFGKQVELNSAEIKEQIAGNPDLSQGDRNQMLNNLPVMVLANNRRVDVSLSTTGEQSTRRYPFNARDYLALIDLRGGEPKPPAKRTSPAPAPKKTAEQ
jgi:outer membrane protein OmpA-like peptidoglycan-associated protein